MRGKEEEYKTMVQRDEEGKDKREHGKRKMKNVEGIKEEDSKRKKKENLLRGKDGRVQDDGRERRGRKR